MKEWWLQLSKREKQSLVMGSVVLLGAMIYFLGWVPFSNKIDSLRQQLIHDQALLVWMRSTDAKLKAFANPSPQASLGNHSILGLIQTSIQKSELHKNVTQLRQLENASVQIFFHKVSFDLLMGWVIQICQQQHLIVKQITITPDDAMGVVSAELVLTR